VILRLKVKRVWFPVSRFLLLDMNPEDVVLIALISSPRALELATREHWYRIPAKHAPKFFDGAQYLAFYLPRSFGTRKWSIDTYATVRGHELARRVDLIPEEPSHARANEVYYKLQLGKTERREPPIVSRRARRVLFLWTNWEKFSTAREWNDLYVRTPAHEKLYDALRAENLDVERETFVREGHSRYRVDFLVYLPQGKIAISVGEAPAREKLGAHDIAFTVTPSQIENHLARLQRTFQHAARELKQNY
jgi:hypothetical protein